MKYNTISPKYSIPMIEKFLQKIPMETWLINVFCKYEIPKSNKFHCSANSVIELYYFKLKKQ